MPRYSFHPEPTYLMAPNMTTRVITLLFLTELAIALTASISQQLVLYCPGC